MKYVGGPAAAPKPAVDVQAPAVAWKEVVGHMEASRETYGPGKDTDWAIQNARVVMQCMQMRANQVSRDLSMAANVKWILDQNPKARIVLWAHNFHVSDGGVEHMGASLRKTYGDKMVVFGFGFSEGSFQAMESGKGLHDFTVPPSEGSLDVMYASTGIPIFALDLRRLPKNGSVSEWFRQPQPARTVGAVYSEQSAGGYIQPLNAPQSFDAMLFVKKTTAARKNPPLPN
jgi:erythromycin esterase